MSTALPSYLTDSLSRFLAGVSATRSINNDDSFDLVAFLAEAPLARFARQREGLCWSGSTRRGPVGTRGTVR